METQIKIAARIYECRDTAKKFYGNEWKEKIKFHMDLIQAVMKKHKIDNEVKATVKVIEGVKDDNGIFTMLMLAALAETLEPTV